MVTKRIRTGLMRLAMLATSGAMMFQATGCVNDPESARQFANNFATGFSYMFLFNAVTTALNI